MEDFLLIRRMKLGDEQAVEQFVRKYYTAILRYCRLHICDMGDAEDLTQETFVRFFRTFDRYRHYGKAANYLYAIAANLCKDYYKKRREIPMELPETSSGGMEQAEMRVDVRAALDKLSPELREIAVLYFIQELQQKEIARILNISLPLVKYRVRRARELLAQQLREEELCNVIE